MKVANIAVGAFAIAMISTMVICLMGKMTINTLGLFCVGGFGAVLAKLYSR